MAIAVRTKAARVIKMQHNQPYEFCTITKSGLIKWIVETVSSVHFDRKRSILGHYMDINERKKSEEKLKASEERYKAILENIEDGYY
jgi:PAS domain S-box-containing protein